MQEFNNSVYCLNGIFNKAWTLNSIQMCGFAYKKEEEDNGK